MLRFFIFIAFFLFGTTVVWAAPEALNPKFELKPSYEYDEDRPVAVAAGHFIKETPFAVVPYEIIVNTPFSQVFEKIQAQLPATGFTLNTANVKTGIITCALQSATPENFVDMGVTTCIYDREEFVYPTAASAVYKLSYVNKNNDYLIAKRVTALNCIATLQLKALDADKTRVTVSISYRFTFETRYENTAFRKDAPPKENRTINFMTNIEQKINLGNAAEPVWVTPKSNGVLEAALLDAAQTS